MHTIYKYNTCMTTMVIDLFLDTIFGIGLHVAICDTVITMNGANNVNFT